ncbi:MAG: TauD/TfdA family dioxygenase, partial [Rhodospirillaceae bacterium]|nr:TauD/TfdA family dioxygenase [Rhodospirillaceae bacterium]
MLYGIEIPADGGDTYFADLAAAHDAMPADLRAAAEDRRVVYSVLADT